MAYTLLSSSNVTLGGNGNPPDWQPFSFYPEDLQEVTSQPGATTTGQINIIFYEDHLTVMVAKDSSGNTLDKAALPCPPHTPGLRPASKPGKLIL